MKPEDLLNPEDFPDDLKWVPAHHKLHPTDPVYLLIAWHWRRVKQSEDTLKATVVELKAVLEARVGSVEAAAKSAEAIAEKLDEIHGTLEAKPAELGVLLEARLTQPVTKSVAELKSLERSLAPLAKAFQVSQRRQLLATLLVGVCLGLLSGLILVLA